MKRIATILAAAALVGQLAGCSPQKPLGTYDNDLERLNLKGRVCTMKQTVYKPLTDSLGEVTPDLSRKSTNDRLYKFDRDGMLTDREWYQNEEPFAWEKYSYYDDGRLQSVRTQSVYFDNDAVDTVEWINETDYVKTKFNEEGRIFATEKSTNIDDYVRMERFDKYGIPAGTIDKWYESGHISRTANYMENAVITHDYTHDKNGNTTIDHTKIDDSTLEIIEMVYTAYDDNGNWTDRITYKVPAGEKRVPTKYTRRTITYYDAE